MSKTWHTLHNTFQKKWLGLLLSTIFTAKAQASVKATSKSVGPFWPFWPSWKWKNVSWHPRCTVSHQSLQLFVIKLSLPWIDYMSWLPQLYRNELHHYFPPHPCSSNSCSVRSRRAGKLYEKIGLKTLKPLWSLNFRLLFSCNLTHKSYLVL